MKDFSKLIAFCNSCEQAPYRRLAEAYKTVSDSKEHIERIRKDIGMLVDKGEISFKKGAKVSPIIVEKTLETNLIEFLQSYQGKSYRPAPIRHSEKIGVINLYDAHIDKIGYGKGACIDENIKSFTNLFHELLDKTLSHDPEYIIFPIGNDFFHTNGPSNHTKGGTYVGSSIGNEESFIKGVGLLIDTLSSILANVPVYVPLIQGNHSEDKDFYLGQVLKAYFRNNPCAYLDMSTAPRKHYQYGLNMLSFAHGNREKGTNVAKLPTLMATEEPLMWGNTKHRCFYLGDIHHKQEYKFLKTIDHPGVEVRFLRSVGEYDKWHVENNYIGIPKTGESHIWDKNKGLASIHLVNR